MKKTHWALLVVFVVSLMFTIPALAADTKCVFNPDGSITCTVSGGGSSGGAGGGGNIPPTPEPVACAPGEVRNVLVTIYEPDGNGTCTMLELIMDICSGQIMAPGDVDYELACPETNEPPPQHPCDTFVVTAGKISCHAVNGWEIDATVNFPEMYLDVRPFPATLVRWPTVVRSSGLSPSSGSGTQDYFGTGSPGNPNIGDLSNIRLTLTLSPVSPMYVTLPHIGTLVLTGAPQIIQWEVPSHPEAGGGPLARNVSGMDELPGDVPMFVGSGRAAYSLSWRLTYQVYQGLEECVSGPNGNGNYNCGGGTGHKEITGYEWQPRSSGGDIPPSAVTNLPGSVAADLNGDGMADAYWDTNLTLRRMDDSGSVDNPTYRRSWNWGGAIYWAVREGQGQIGWPGGK